MVAYRRRLSPRQQEALRLARKGMTNDEIARTLGISVNTVKRHLSVAYGRLQAVNRTHAVSLYDDMTRKDNPGQRGACVSA